MGRGRENVSTGFQEELVPKPRSEAWSWSQPDEVGCVVAEDGHSMCKGLEAQRPGVFRQPTTTTLQS